ncbi:MAG: hypothetical protein OEZ39_12875 [Gammaproteobacteria bacterium]|nr:hypothetical protein [Gammaproteobacteria bacterium]MDH5652741.1 hypothetical protein [Gammaproteobacteria bacterium]
MMQHYQSILPAWFATPHSDVEVADRANSLEQHRRLRPLSQQRQFVLLCGDLVLDWWRNCATRSDLDRLFIDARTRRHQALANLVAGQLLISRRLSGAMSYLDKGLDLADGLLKPEDYFVVYNRHNDLRCLSLSEAARPAQDLPTLLNEARVIQRLNTERPGFSKDNWPNRFSMP